MPLPTRNPRIHILGLGSIGTFAAHALAETPAPLRPASVTLLLHRPSLLEPFLAGGRRITLQTHEGARIQHGGYRVEVLAGGDRWSRDPGDDSDAHLDGDADADADFVEHAGVDIASINGHAHGNIASVNGDSGANIAPVNRDAHGNFAPVNGHGHADANIASINRNAHDTLTHVKPTNGVDKFIADDNANDVGDRLMANDVIDHLIVSVKATQTVAALRPLRHRLTAASSILFLQNGSGMLDDVNRELFVDEASRPTYIIGVIAHGVTLARPFEIIHTGPAATWLGCVPRCSFPPSCSPTSLSNVFTTSFSKVFTASSSPTASSSTTSFSKISTTCSLSTSSSTTCSSPTASSTPTASSSSTASSSPPASPYTTSSSYLLRALPLIPRLNATSLPYHSVLQAQLEKLALNAFCNPLCALADAPNAFLLTIPATKHALVSEISAVARALPELRGVRGVASRFSVPRLERTVDNMVAQTVHTTCSMVVDVRRGRQTEIEYINGYWSRRGREVGVPTPLNDALVHQILARQRLAAEGSAERVLLPELALAPAECFAVANGV